MRVKYSVITTLIVGVFGSKTTFKYLNGGKDWTDTLCFEGKNQSPIDLSANYAKILGTLDATGYGY